MPEQTQEAPKTVTEISELEICHAAILYIQKVVLGPGHPRIAVLGSHLPQWQIHEIAKGIGVSFEVATALLKRLGYQNWK